jgi:hypothetical protein
MFPLAQVDVEMVGPIVPWIAGASLTVFLLNQALCFFKEHIREQPTPSDTYATKPEHAELKERVHHVESLVDANYKTLDQKRSVSVANLHDALKEQTEALNKRIDEVPNRVISLLTETKKLHGK